MSSEPERQARGKLAESLPDPPLTAVPDEPSAGSDAGPDPAPPAGSPGATSEPRPRAACPYAICDGSGWVVTDETEQIARPCKCRPRRIEKARSRGVSATLPRRFRGVSFDRPPVSEMSREPKMRRTVAEVREFCEQVDERLDEGRGLWIQGPTGTGKTTLAMLASKAALDARRTAAIYSLPGLLARIRRTFDGEAGEDSYFTFFQRLVSVDLLHLDDLGAESRTEWVLEQLYSIIDRRYSDERSIVVTTNLEEPELFEQLGERIVSRLTEICGDPLLLEGGDKRLEYRPAPSDNGA
ncbi:MAG TPA: ATP-binding protein [Solirubrobacterales bacterium]|nr:ATP-binding protein [Solirubrobacterales bacterium]